VYLKIALITFGNEESYGLLFVAAELLRLGREIRFFDSEQDGVGREVCEWGPISPSFLP